MSTMTAEQAAEAAKGLTFEKVWAALMETRQRMEETRQRMEEAHKQTEEMHQETEKAFLRMEKGLADLKKTVGGLGNMQGRLTEALFEANLWKKFNKIGFAFTSQVSRKEFMEGDNAIAEADFFLENGEYAMPVEVKTDLSVGHVDEHLEHIAKIRQYMDAHGDSRKLVGAIAGEIVPNNVMRYAQKKGLYVLTQTGDSIAIASAPQGFKPREWN